MTQPKIAPARSTGKGPGGLLAVGLLVLLSPLRHALGFGDLDGGHAFFQLS